MKQRMKSLGCFLLGGLVLQAAGGREVARAADAPFRYELPKSLTGTVYAANSNLKRVLFKFTREMTRTGDKVKVIGDYTTPDGKLAAREVMVYEKDTLVLFELEEFQIKTHGIVKLSQPAKKEAGWDFKYISNNGAKTNVSTEPLRPDTLVGDMIGPFLVAHWSELMKGGDVKCRYIVPDRTETVGFKFAKHGETTYQGKPAVIIKMSASSFIIAALVDPLYFTLEKGGEHRVLQYDGRTTPMIKDANKWKELDAVTVFDWN